MGPSEAVGGKNLPELWDVDEQDGSLKDEKILAAIDFINLAENRQSYPDLTRNIVNLLKNTDLSEEAKRKIAQVKPSVLRDVFPHLFEKTSDPRLAELKARAQTPQGAVEIVRNIGQFQIESEQDRIEIAKECAQTPQGAHAVAWSIEKFEISDEQARIDLAKLCAKTPEGVEAVVDNIQNFKINDPQTLIDLAKACLKNRYSTIALACSIDDFKVTDEKDRIDLAKVWAKTPDAVREFAGIIDALEISNEQDRIELAKMCAQYPKGADAVATFIRKFKITDEKARIDLAKMCTQFDLGAEAVARAIQKFEITNEQGRADLAIACAKTPEGAKAVLRYLEGFNIKDKQARMLILKSCVSHPDCAQTFIYGDLYHGIKSEQDLLEILRVCAQTSEGLSAVIQNIQKLNILDEKYRVELAKICTKTPQGVNQFVDSIQNFKISDEKDRTDLAKACAKTPRGAEALAYDFKNFELVNQQASVEVLKACAHTSLGRRAAGEYIHNFGINNSVINEFMRSIRDSNPPLNLEGRLELLIRYARAKGISLETTFKNLKAAKVSANPALQKEILDQVTFAFVMYEAAGPEAQEWIKKSGLMDQALSLKMDPLRVAFIVKAFRVAEDPELRKAFDALSKTSLTGKSGRAKEQAVSREFYLKNLNLVLLKPEIKDEVLRKYADRLNITGIKQDHLKMNRLLEALNLLVDHKEEIGEAMPTVLERMVPDKSKDKEVVERSNALVGLFQFEAAAYLKEFTESSISDLLLKRLKEMVSIGEVANFQAKYETTLARFREFPLIGAYAGKLNSLPDRDTLLGHYGRFLTAALNGNFKETRESVENNPHLQNLQANHPEVLKAWHAGRPSIEVEALLGDKTASKVPLKMDYSAQLKEKLVVHGHLDKGKIPELLAYFDDPTKVDKIRENLLQKGDDPYAKLQLLCLDLIEAKDEKSALEELYKHLQPMGTEVDNFKNDIKGFLDLLAKSAIRKENPYKGMELVFTDDPNDYLLSGTEVAGSCQSITAGANTNKCLLSYLLDGKNRLITIKDPTGKIVTRSVIRLLLDKTTNQPVLFQEAPYSSTNNPQLNELLFRHAKAWASDMGIPYASFKERHPNSLVSLGGPVPYEYSDAAGGIQPNGVYTI